MLFREFRIDFLGSSAFVHLFSKREKRTTSNKNLFFRKNLQEERKKLPLGFRVKGLVSFTPDMLPMSQFVLQEERNKLLL
jgi:hypothetical protein